MEHGLGACLRQAERKHTAGRERDGLCVVEAAKLDATRVPRVSLESSGISGRSGLSHRRHYHRADIVCVNGRDESILVFRGITVSYQESRAKNAPLQRTTPAPHDPATFLTSSICA
eukprot:COSAG02_NODE_42852_length_380_cov_1.106762_1_plen_115_part_01